MYTKKLLLGWLLASLMTFGLSAPVAWNQPAPQRVEITAKRFAFSPAEVTLKKGEPVVLALKSEDVAHGLQIRELNVVLKVSAGGSAEVQFTPQKTGDFVGHCAVFCGMGHGKMALTVHVVD